MLLPDSMPSDVNIILLPLKKTRCYTPSIENLLSYKRANPLAFYAGKFM